MRGVAASATGYLDPAGYVRRTQSGNSPSPASSGAAAGSSLLHSYPSLPLSIHTARQTPDIHTTTHLSPWHSLSATFVGVLLEPFPPPPRPFFSKRIATTVCTVHPADRFRSPSTPPRVQSMSLARSPSLREEVRGSFLEQGLPKVALCGPLVLNTYISLIPAPPVLPSRKWIGNE